jgi:hypothetical protein
MAATVEESTPPDMATAMVPDAGMSFRSELAPFPSRLAVEVLWLVQQLRRRGLLANTES